MTNLRYQAQSEHPLIDCKLPTKFGRCSVCALRQQGICGSLTGEELLEFRKIAFRRTYEPGEHIMTSGEQTKFFAGVTSGAVKLTKVLVDGRQQVVGLLLPPDCLISTFGHSNPYFAEAATKVEICRFSEAGFVRMLDRFSGLKQRLMEQTLGELDAARDWMVLLGRKTAEEKVASLLHMLTMRSNVLRPEYGAEHQNIIFELHLRREEIADFLGLTLETVCRQIKALRKKGVIQMFGVRRFSILDTDALNEIAGQHK